MVDIIHTLHAHVHDNGGGGGGGVRTTPENILRCKNVPVHSISEDLIR